MIDSECFLDFEYQINHFDLFSPYEYFDFILKLYPNLFHLIALKVDLLNQWVYIKGVLNCIIECKVGKMIT